MTDPGQQDETPIYERLPEEPNLWYDRFVQYLQMGPSRSLLGAVNAEKAKKSKEKQTSNIPGAWSEAAKQWRWKERAEAWDEYRRKQVFTTGNAFDINRIEKLSKFSECLEQEIKKMFEALEKEKALPVFNAQLYAKYLESLEALAAETGGRVKKNEMTIMDIPTKELGVAPGENGCDP